MAFLHQKLTSGKQNKTFSRVVTVVEFHSVAGEIQYYFQMNILKGFFDTTQDNLVDS